jgi:glucokinase
MILAFESGGTKLVASAATSDGTLQETIREARPHANDAAATMRQLIQMGRQLAQRHPPLEAIGFGYGGLVRRGSQSAYLCLHEAGWESIDALAILQDEFGVPVHIENDCKVAALAEATAGAGRGARSVFYATVGTGVGGGLVRDGSIVALHDGGECEIGHLPALPGGPLCGCGGAGCVEAICAGPGMLALAAGRFSTTPEIFAAWRSGNESATALVEFCAGHLARALASVSALLHPDRIVLGGGVASGNPDYVELIRTLTRPLVVSYFRDSFDLRVAQLGESVVTQGAALLAVQKEFLCKPVN